MFSADGPAIIRISGTVNTSSLFRRTARATGSISTLSSTEEKEEGIIMTRTMAGPIYGRDKKMLKALLALWGGGVASRQDWNRCFGEALARVKKIFCITFPMAQAL